MYLNFGTFSTNCCPPTFHLNSQTFLGINNLPNFPDLADTLLILLNNATYVTTKCLQHFDIVRVWCNPLLEASKYQQKYWNRHQHKSWRVWFPRTNIWVNPLLLLHWQHHDMTYTFCWQSPADIPSSIYFRPRISSGVAAPAVFSSKVQPSFSKIVLVKIVCKTTSRA